MIVSNRDAVSSMGGSNHDKQTTYISFGRIMIILAILPNQRWILEPLVDTVVSGFNHMGWCWCSATSQLRVNMTGMRHVEEMRSRAHWFWVGNEKISIGDLLIRGPALHGVLIAVQWLVSSEHGSYYVDNGWCWLIISRSWSRMINNDCSWLTCFASVDITCIHCAVHGCFPSLKGWRKNHMRLMLLCWEVVLVTPRYGQQWRYNSRDKQIQWSYLHYHQNMNWLGADYH